MASSSKSANVYAPASSTYPYTFGVSFNETGTDTANNTSTISLTGTMYAKNIRWSTTTANTLALYWVDDNENSGGKYITQVDISTFVKNYTYTLSGNVTAKHKADGTLSGYAKLVFIKNNGNSYAPPSTTLCTDNTWLSWIPRESSMSFGAGYIEESLYIGISRNSTSFTHKIYYSFGNLNGTVTSNAGDSCYWTIPSSFYSQIPYATYGYGTLTLETYSGSTKIGSSKSYSVLIYCRESRCTPTISGTIKDIDETTKALTGSESTLVDYKSNAQILLTYSPKNSSIAKLYINDVQQTLDTIYKFTPSSSSYTVKIVDNRGYSNSITFQSTNSSGSNYFKRIEYIPLSFTAKTTRPTQTGTQMQVSIDGKFFNGYFNSSTANTLTITWKYRIKGASSWTTGSTSIALTKSGNTFYATDKTIGSSWDYTKIYEVEYTIKDKLMSYTYLCTVSKGTPSFAIYEDGIMLNGIFLAIEKSDEW